MLLLVFLAALATRTAWGVIHIARSDNPLALEFPDEEQYWLAAQSLARGEGLRDELGFRATRMPLYPGFLSVFANRPNGSAYARVAQWVIGALAAASVAALGATLAGRRVGLAAGLIVAFDPFLIFFSSLLLSETIFVTALCTLWLLLAPVVVRREGRSPVAWWAAIGALAAVCVFLRESSLGLVLLGLLFVVLARRCERRIILGAMLAGGFVVVSLIPWAARNQRVTGHWCWLTHRGGISLYDGLGPQATGASDLGGVKQSEAVRGLSESAWDRYFREQALDAARRDPWRVVRLAGVKMARMWNPLPNVETYRSGAARWVSAAWTIPIFSLALLGIFVWPLCGRSHGCISTAYLLLPAIYLSALHCLFIGSVRYRIPAMPMLAVLAAVAAVTTIWRRPPASLSESVAPQEPAKPARSP